MVPLSDSVKPDAYRPPTREQIVRARAMYAQGFAVSRILAHCDMSLGTLYYWLDGGPREANGPVFPPIPRRREVVGKRRSPLKGDAASLAARLWRTCERQARDTENRLKALNGPPDERDIRMLATLVRAVRDLSRLENGQAPRGERATFSDEAEEDPEALRAELLRKIDALRAQPEEPWGVEGGELSP
ncbi:MAG TPA: hypothetical protein VHA55_13910 [Pseudorhodoplanes sp.]|jgi:hypothetical protein|nr:hypothetical protein [Pseudorhodoplanes sp.]